MTIQQQMIISTNKSLYVYLSPLLQFFVYFSSRTVDSRLKLPLLFKNKLRVLPVSGSSSAPLLAREVARGDTKHLYSDPIILHPHLRSGVLPFRACVNSRCPDSDLSCRKLQRSLFLMFHILENIKIIQLMQDLKNNYMLY